MNFEKFENMLSKFVMPIADKVNNNKMLSAVAEGFVRTTPIILGVAVFAIIGNLPIPGWVEWLTANQLKSHFDAALGASTSVISLYVVFSIAYAYSKKNDVNAISGGLIALASFILITPQMVTVGEESVGAISINYIDSNGLVVGLIVSLFVGALYVALTKKGMVFKMPESVPPMVSESLGPVFVAIIIFGIMFAIRIGFSLTPFQTAFDFIQTIITKPLLSIGLSAPAIIFFYALGNLFWFFGIHPNVVYGPINPLLTTMVLANIDAFQKGQSLPYLVPAIVLGCVFIGGSANTLGLLACMVKAKSKRYRSILKLSIVPNIFNINEPVIFGTPTMLNPIFFVPMILSCILMGIAGWILASVLPMTYNPLMALLPWTTPCFILFFLVSGIPGLIILAVCLVINILVYFLFFKVADKQACEEERREELQQEHATSVLEATA